MSQPRHHRGRAALLAALARLRYSDTRYTNRMDERISKIERIRARLIAGCSAEELAEMYCPVCAAALAFTARPNRRDFFLRCTVNNGHLAIHDKATDDPPAWWKSHEINGWYE